jgi:hypothetical protein
MRMILGAAVAAALAVGASAPARADSMVQCPFFEATRTIVNLPNGWSADEDTSTITDYRVEGQGNQQILVCEYGSAGTVSRNAPNGEICKKFPGRRFRCTTIVTGPQVVAQGQIILPDNGNADLDGSGQSDMRLRPGGPLLRLLDPRNGASFSLMGPQQPKYDACVNAFYSGNSIPLIQLNIGSWLCVSTSDGNYARVQVANIQGVPQLPLPLTLFLNYTTWSGAQNEPPPLAQTHSTGLLNIPQTFLFDLDEGAIGQGPSADFQFQAQTATQLFITPRNGAQLAVGNKTNRGYDGCANENFSPVKVPLATLAVGNYICALTADGRIAQFRINAITGTTPKTLKIGYTTWE